MNRKKALEIIKSIIKQVAPAAQVILYGSEARGDARPDSDFDILIIEDTDVITDRRRQEITRPLYELFYNQGIDVQPILKTKQEWENPPFLTPFYCNIKNEGVIL